MIEEAKVTLARKRAELIARLAAPLGAADRVRLQGVHSESEPEPETRDKHYVVIGLGRAGFHATCTCGWRSSANWVRSWVVRDRNEHLSLTRREDAP